MERARYTRQIRLAEVGEAGQERLSKAEVVLGGEGFARDVERTYLELAGVRVVDGGAPEDVDVAALGLRHEAARDVGEGALRALVAIRGILLGVRVR